MDRPDRTRLVVLFGGQSPEHEVSLVTARHVLAAADLGRYDVVPVSITPDGTWRHAEEAGRALAAGPDALPDALPTEGPAVDPFAVTRPAPGRASAPTVVLPLLHGPLGEDGTVQGLLELADVAYVGCGVLASALAMDKGRAKEVFAARGLPQAAHVTAHEVEASAPGFAEATVERLGLPLFVKPANMGSSVGVSKAGDLPGLRTAIATAATYDEWLVVEEAIAGREIEVAVLGNLEPRASSPGEVQPAADFYDYDDKYRHGQAKLMIPAPLGDDEAAEAQRLALAAYRALGCEGMARVDFFYEAHGRGFLLNEVNTIPGFTPISMYPRMWEASGLPYGALIDELVRLAMARHQRRAAKRRRR